MKIYEILVPGRREEFETWLLEQFGGYTNAGERNGAWVEKEAKPLPKTHYDVMLAYQVATDSEAATYTRIVQKAPKGPESTRHVAEDVTTDIFSALAGKAAEIWPKEKAFFVARIGYAEIIDGKGQADGGSPAP